jgi:hypothetical protein
MVATQDMLRLFAAFACQHRPAAAARNWPQGRLGFARGRAIADDRPGPKRSDNVRLA